MSYRQTDLVTEIALCKQTHIWKNSTDLSAEVSAIVAALASETITHDKTIDTPASLVLIIAPPNGITNAGAGYHSRFTNDMILLINAGLGGNLSKSQIISAIDDNFAIAHAPAVIDVPYASANASPPITGTVVSVTNGNWTGSPSSYTYQWKRDGTTNLGTSASYTLVSGDTGGHIITCVVTATNATGSQAAPPSNGINVP